MAFYPAAKKRATRRQMICNPFEKIDLPKKTGPMRRR
jgi:hypothetical protein